MKNPLAVLWSRPFVLFCLLLITGTCSLKAQCPAATPLVINTVTVAESRCAASGTATVAVSGGSTPYTFSIVAGPTLAPPQSSNVLQSLEPGTYTVQVTDNCNTSVTQSFTIMGSYAVPSFNITTQSPGCSNSSDGSLTVNMSNGLAPLTYSLVSPSPVTAGPQAGNVFTGLPAGTYYCQVADSCGNFQTRSATIAATSGTMSIVPFGILYEACDSFAIPVEVNLSPAATNYKPPYTFNLQLPDGRVITQVLTTPKLIGGAFIMDTFYFRYHHTVGANESLNVSVTNNCGVTQNGQGWMGVLDMSVNGFQPAGCGSPYAFTFDPYRDNSAFPSPFHCSTLTYTLVSPSGTVLATQVNNSTFSGYPTGAGYKVIRQDCCEKDTLVFDWNSPAFGVNFATITTPGTCKAGTTKLTVFFNSNIIRTGSVVVASGPSSITTADGVTHALSYPDTTLNVNLTNGVVLTYFTVGTYKLYFITDCGEKDSTTITIAPSDLVQHSFSAMGVKGCNGTNKFLLQATTNAPIGAGAAYAFVSFNGANAMFPDVSPWTDSAVGFASGTYNVTCQFNDSYNPVILNAMSGWGCDVITDTITIANYTQPVFNPSAAIAVCGATRQLALLPDSTSGISPYTFQSIAGPVTTSTQSSPVFPGMPSGTYTFQMVDACANSYTRAMTIDTLAVPGVATTGSTCSGGSATFTLPASPFYNYSWQLPGGGSATGNALTINPITTTDTGTYKISVTSNIGGCSNTTSKSYTLSFCMALPEAILRFDGQWKSGNIALNWQTADEETVGYYIVERSTDGYRFEPIGQVEAKGGTLNAYTAFDTHVPAGGIYYRLQMAGKNGGLRYSDIIVFNKAHTQLPNIYPRLVTGNTPVTITYPAVNRAVSIRLVGIDGKVYRNVHVAAGSTETTIDMSNLASGSYVVAFTGIDGTVATKVWKQ